MMLRRQSSWAPLVRSIVLSLVVLAWMGARTWTAEQRLSLNPMPGISDSDHKSVRDLEPASRRPLQYPISDTMYATDNDPRSDDLHNSSACARRPPSHLSHHEKCAFVREHCAPFAAAFLNYLEYYYCTFGSHTGLRGLFYVLMFLWMLVLFYVLGDTADTYFCPSLAKIADGLNLSPNIAGVTFLALGNGAPDIATILVGVLSGSPDIGIGEPLGTGMFVTTIVMGIIAFIVPVKVARRPFVRDVGFFLVSVCMLVLFYSDRKFTFPESLSLLILYIVYVVVVVVGRIVFIRMQRNKAIEAAAKALLAPLNINYGAFEDDGISPPVTQPSHSIVPPPRPPPVFHELEDRHEYLVDEREVDMMTETDSSISDDDTITLLPKQRSNVVVVSASETDPLLPPAVPYSRIQSLRRSRSLAVLKQIVWHKRFYRKFIEITLFPFDIARKLTTPNVDDDQFSPLWYASSIALAPLFAAAVVDPESLTSVNLGSHHSFPLYALFLVLAPVLFAIAYPLIRRDRDRKRSTPVFIVASLLGSVAWIFLAANELIALLETFGLLFRISNAILAMTVLAWGNSIGDLVADIVVARKGHPEMAVGAVYGSPMLNLLVGLGSALTAQTSKKSMIVTDDHKTFAIVMLNGAFLIASLVSVLFFVPFCKFRFTRPIAVYLMLLYLLYLILTILIQADSLAF